ncbi:ribonuclease PH, partial [bacterium]|nr:ribonuclease PH [bacterium]
MRADGRNNNELRKISFTHNFTKHALGSVLVEFGDTKVIVCASADLKKPKWMAEEDNRGWVTAEYSLLPSATNTRCKR